MVAKCTVRVHRLRTVYHVVHDLVALQLVCRAAAPCTEKLTVYMQLYVERYTPMAPDAAASILLTEIDLQQVLRLPIYRVPCILGPLHYNQVLACNVCNLFKGLQHLRCPTLQAVILHASRKWGGIAGLEDHEYNLLLEKSKDACAKNASRVKLQQQRDSSDEGQQQLALEAKQTEENAALFPGGIARRVRMIAALSVHGLRLRADSKLCENYICRGLGRPEDIANTMRDVQCLFDYTDYGTRKVFPGFPGPQKHA